MEIMAIKEYKLQEIGKFQNYENVFSKYHVSTNNMEGHKMPNFYPKLGNYFPKNSILMSNIRPYFNKVWYSDREGSKSPNVLCFIVKNKNAISKYIYFLICDSKFNNFWSKTSKGTTMPVGDKNALLNYKFKLPDLDDQQQIINIIEPFERLKEKFNIKIKYLKDILHNHDKKSKEIDILNNWAKITTGKRNANYAIQNGNYRFFSCSINKIQFCNSFSFDCESLLLAGNGDIGNVIYFNGKFDAYQRTYVIQCKNFIGNIYFSLVKNKKFFESNSKGSVIKFLTLSTISNIKISLNKEINNIRLAILKYIFICEKIVFNTNLIIDLIIKKMIN